MENKYRAWDKKIKRMLSAKELMDYPALIKPDGSGFGYRHHSSSSRDEDYPHLIPMRFTGLEDKNGKEIYARDIITIPRKTPNTVRALVVEWSDKSLGWVFKDVDSNFQTGYYAELSSIPLEIVGNRFENPELLKGGD